MRLFIDGDAFPNLLKPIIFRAIEKFGLETFVVSNKKITIGKSRYITDIIVEQGADEADHKIVEMVEAEDLVITADIPLASRVIEKKAYPIDHRGELYDSDNIKQYLAVRALMEKIRDTGEMTKGPAPFGQKDANNFANQLNSFLQKQDLQAWL